MWAGFRQLVALLRVFTVCLSLAAAAPVVPLEDAAGMVGSGAMNLLPEGLKQHVPGGHGAAARGGQGRPPPTNPVTAAHNFVHGQAETAARVTGDQRVAAGALVAAEARVGRKLAGAVLQDLGAKAIGPAAQRSGPGDEHASARGPWLTGLEHVGARLEVAVEAGAMSVVNRVGAAIVSPGPETALLGAMGRLMAAATADLAPSAGGVEALSSVGGKNDSKLLIASEAERAAVVASCCAEMARALEGWGCLPPDVAHASWLATACKAGGTMNAALHGGGGGADLAALLRQQMSHTAPAGAALGRLKELQGHSAVLRWVVSQVLRVATPADLKAAQGPAVMLLSRAARAVDAKASATAIGAMGASGAKAWEAWANAPPPDWRSLAALLLSSTAAQMLPSWQDAVGVFSDGELREAAGAAGAAIESTAGAARAGAGIAIGAGLRAAGAAHAELLQAEKAAVDSARAAGSFLAAQEALVVPIAEVARLESDVRHLLVVEEVESVVGEIASSAGTAARAPAQWADAASESGGSATVAASTRTVHALPLPFGSPGHSEAPKGTPGKEGGGVTDLMHALGEITAMAAVSPPKPTGVGGSVGVVAFVTTAELDPYCAKAAIALEATGCLPKEGSAGGVPHANWMAAALASSGSSAATRGESSVDVMLHSSLAASRGSAHFGQASVLRWAAAQVVQAVGSANLKAAAAAPGGPQCPTLKLLTRSARAVDEKAAAATVAAMAKGDTQLLAIRELSFWCLRSCMNAWESPACPCRPRGQVNALTKQQRATYSL